MNEQRAQQVVDTLNDLLRAPYRADLWTRDDGELLIIVTTSPVGGTGERVADDVLYIHDATLPKPAAERA